MKSIFLTFIFNLFCILLFAQSTENSGRIPGAQPDFPGTLVIDFGPNFLRNAPDSMDLNIFGSRGFGLYYLYEVYFPNSHFSFHPGIGFGFEKYSFSNNITLSDVSGDDPTRIVPLDDDIYTSVDKSQLATNYLEIPLELRFFSNKEIEGKGFMAAVGGKFGFLLDSYTKIKYEQGGDTKKQKLKQGYNLNPIRYGVQARVGWRGINLFGYYGFSPLFKKDKGPEQTDANNIKVGLSIALF